MFVVLSHELARDIEIIFALKCANTSSLVSSFLVKPGIEMKVEVEVEVNFVSPIHTIQASLVSLA